MRECDKAKECPWGCWKEENLCSLDEDEPCYGPKAGEQEKEDNEN